MNAEFNWWLLLLGLGVGAGLTWLILSDLAGREEEISEREAAEEVAWVGEALAAAGRPTSPETIGRVLELHRTWVRRDRSDGDGDGEAEITGAGPTAEA
jgi:hypothetical protein